MKEHTLHFRACRLHYKDQQRETLKGRGKKKEKKRKNFESFDALLCRASEDFLLQCLKNGDIECSTRWRKASGISALGAECRFFVSSSDVAVLAPRDARSRTHAYWQYQNWLGTTATYRVFPFFFRQKRRIGLCK